MKKLSLVPVVLGVFAFAGCSNQTPLAPAAAAGGAGELSAKPSAAAPGVYTLTSRFRYASQGSGIASGTSQSRNFTWTAGS